MNPFRKKSLETPRPSSPPPVAPRRRRSQLKRAPTPTDPFNPTPSDSDSDPFLHPPRQSLDAEGFKRLMLGLTTPDSSTDASSRHSFEPIQEDKTPRTSLDSTTRTKLPPPPPKPRARTGGKSPVSPGRPESISDKPPPPPPPPPQARPTSPTPVSPPSPAPSLQKRIAPSPPLSRRHSVQSKSFRELERPVTPGKPKPPVPPVRRMKSVSARPGHGRTQSMVVGMMPPPPPPPPRSRAGSLEVPEKSGVEESVEKSVEVATPVETPPAPISKPQEEMDILVDLQKLQREVDELRGKYEGRKISIGAEVEGM